MPTPFEVAWAARQGDLDAAFAEEFILEPLAPPSPSPASAPGRRPNVNLLMTTSVDRERIAFPGIFVDAGAMLHAHGRRMADNATHGVAAERPMIDVAIAALPKRPRQGDRVRRLATGEVFEVVMFLPEAPVRAWIYLAEGVQRPEDPR